MKDPVYVRELSRYSVDSLAKKMQLDSDAVQDLIRALAVAGVLGAPLSSLNSDDEVMDAAPVIPGARDCFQFTWVGIAIFRDRPIVVYPKYINKDADYFLSEDGRAEMQQVLRVVRKGADGLSVLHKIDDDSVSATGMLALMLALIDSFSENGIYSNYLRVSKTNGNGAIDWERTISRYQPFLSNGVPVYFEYETTETSRDIADYVTRLHRCVLTRCSKYLSETGLAELLSIDPIELSAEDLDDFGERDYVLYKLEQERASQFITWKQNVIDMLRLFISSDEVSTSANDASCLGTPVFQNLWEDACQTAFGNQLDRPIGELGIELTGKWAGISGKKLIELIPRPKWTKWSENGSIPCGDVATLIPDVVSIADTGEGGKAFCIYDAKYYKPALGEKVFGVPGVESVTKQILYQRAYRDFVRDNGIGAVANIFLVPTDGNQPAHLGRVEFPGVFDSLDKPFVDGIEMWALPARDMYDCYLNGTAVDGDYVRRICGLA